MKKEEITIGTPVLYYPYIADEGQTPCKPIESVTMSAPWWDGDEYRCHIRDVKGGVSISHLEAILPGAMKSVDPRRGIDVIDAEFQSEKEMFMQKNYPKIK